MVEAVSGFPEVNATSVFGGTPEKVSDVGSSQDVSSSQTMQKEEAGVSNLENPNQKCRNRATLRKFTTESRAQSIPENNREPFEVSLWNRVLTQLKANPSSLDHVSDRLKKELGSLNHVSDGLKKDKEFILLAIKQDPYALYYASDELRDDEEVVMAGVKEYGLVFEAASNRLKDQESTVRRALREQNKNTHIDSAEVKEMTKAHIIKHASKRVQDVLALESQNTTIVRMTRALSRK